MAASVFKTPVLGIYRSRVSLSSVLYVKKGKKCSGCKKIYNFLFLRFKSHSVYIISGSLVSSKHAFVHVPCLLCKSIDVCCLRINFLNNCFPSLTTYDCVMYRKMFSLQEDLNSLPHREADCHMTISIVKCHSMR